MTALVARTRRLEDGPDLLAAAGGDGVLVVQGDEGLAGRGEVARVPVAEAAAFLAAIEVDDEVGCPGTGAVAFGALPFHPDPAAEVVVPAAVWGAAGEDRWLTTIGPAGATPPDPRAASPSVVTPPASVTVTPARDPRWWCDLVARATKELQAAEPGGLTKVVLAREVFADADVPFDRGAILQRLQAAYGGCFLYLVDGFLGASPELLVRRAGDLVRAQPMAGTAPRGTDPERDAALAADLLTSATYRREHQITIDMVYDTLLPWCSYLDYEAEPSVVAVANVQHLATFVEGRLSQPTPSVLDLVAALHPTPAVSGSPREAASAWIEAHEGFDRGRYAGTVGWVDGSGNGTWAVSIRCAEVAGTRARLFAGNGIVADSDPETELAETEAKLAAVLSALSG